MAVLRGGVLSSSQCEGCHEDSFMRRLLEEEVRRARLSLSLKQLEALEGYLELLGRWGGRMNLTARTEPDWLIGHHFPDAFAVAAEMGVWAEGRRCIDAGAGAGLPGVILAATIPGLKVTAVEANRRKCAFLRTVAHELDLDVQVLEGRLEELKVAPHDLAVSRATWAPGEWMERSCGLVRPGGRVVLFLARGDGLPPATWELRESRRVHYSLSDGTPRLLVVMERVPDC